MTTRWLERLAFVVVGALGCAATNAAADDLQLDALARQFDLLSEVFAHIENHYVDAIDPTRLIQGAVRGALGALDAHSAFFSTDEYKDLLDATEGEYAGVGVEVDIRDGLPEVLAVFANSPAARAGIGVGDRILAVDGHDVEGLDFDAVQQMLHGPVGSKIKLQLAHEAPNSVRQVNLVRAWIRVAPLEERRLAQGIHYILVKSFSRRVSTDLEALLGSGDSTHGLVLDMRGNPGGLFDEAVAVCDLFLKDGPIVSIVGRGGVMVEAYTAHASGTQPPFKIAVLIDRNSASAAEIVAGALHDRGRARLFGERSYGKGSVQSILDLSDGSGLKLTVARYLTPSGRQIDGHGIEPDEALARLESSAADPVLDAAVHYLSSP